MSPIVFAYALDLAIGDPRGLPHPVRWIGGASARGEPLARAAFPRTPQGERVAGAVLTAGIVGLAALAAGATLAAARRVDARLGRALEIVLAASTLATRDLLEEGRAVHRALAGGDLPRARERVARIVGRDTDALDEAGVARAAIETLAESTCDGIVAPLFFLVLGGVPAAVAFKAVSTLDSTIGHREAPYADFGTAAARLDDVANFVPARLTALAIALVAPLAGGSLARALATARADGRRHRSVNAGFPEAAIAGALGVRLGGPLAYDGVPVALPYLGADGAAPTTAALGKALRLCALASALAGACATLARRRA